MKRFLRSTAVSALGLALLCAPAPAEAPGLGEAERAAILAHGPWPPAPERDGSNRVSGNVDAIKLGFRLFFESRLSRGAEFSCATCHRPEQAFAETRAVSEGRVPLRRNAPGLNNVRLKRWLGWDGGSDSLWAASIRPFLEANEFDAGPEHVAALFAADEAHRADFEAAFGDDPKARAGDAVLANVGKALAAFQETLISPPSAFDAFREGLAAGDAAAVAAYPVEARRGAALFVGSAGCAACHAGPTFSNGGFAAIGVPPAEGAAPDAGRAEGIAHVKGQRFSRAGPFNDDPGDPRAGEAAALVASDADSGAFAIPALRGASQTAPFFHNGSAATLAGAVRGHRPADAPRLDEQDVADLVAFLETL